jgi:hypothetical protein
MQSVIAKNLDETVEAWDLYSSGAYDRVRDIYGSSANPELRDLCILAGFERDAHAGYASTGEGLFAQLVAGMAAHFRGDHRLSARELGGWLIHKSYYTENIIRRFVESAYRSGNWSLMFSVSKRLLEVKSHRPIAAESAFLSLYHRKMYPESVKIFDAFREHFRGSDIIQKAACALIQVSRFDEAERMLLDLYKKITGSDYRSRFEEAYAGWAETIQKIDALEKRENRTFDESMRLGLAYLFSDKHGEAMRVLKGIKSSL